MPHTRSLTAEFSLSSINIGLEEHLKCDDTSSLEFVFPGCFGISGGGGGGGGDGGLGNKLERLLCIKAGWKKLFY